VDESRCRAGEGLLRCFQPRTLVADYGHPEFCFWHAKKAAGLVACDARGCAKFAGHRPPCSPIPPERKTITPDNVFSDERRELERWLRSAG